MGPMVSLIKLLLLLVFGVSVKYGKCQQLISLLIKTVTFFHYCTGGKIFEIQVQCIFYSINGCLLYVNSNPLNFNSNNII